MRNLFALAACALFISLPASALSLNFSKEPIPEFREVSPGVYRGGHPNRQGLEQLAGLGVRTILDLENDEDAIYFERLAARRMGMNFLSRPLSKFWAPDDSETREILSLLAEPSLRPIFIHCTLGQDRTGLMVALYRVYAEKMDPAEAYSEMLENGFKRKFMKPMDHYYRKRTGFAGMRERD